MLRCMARRPPVRSGGPAAQAERSFLSPWREPYSIARGWRPYPRIDDLPGEGWSGLPSKKGRIMFESPPDGKAAGRRPKAAPQGEASTRHGVHPMVFSLEPELPSAPRSVRAPRLHVTGAIGISLRQPGLPGRLPSGPWVGSCRCG